ncbi:MAG: hypothetical protein GY870_02445, partial [archaeon]|nr:hypothetical protein [archaeon]
MKNNDLQLENLDDYEKKINDFIGKAEIFIEKDPKVKHWELFGGVQSGSGIKIEKGFLKSSTTGQTSVITLRLYGEKGNVGSACISRLSMPFIESAIERAIKMMKVSIPNSDFIGLASPPKAYPKVIAPWDSNISQLEVEDSLEIINFFMKQMNRDEKIKS